MKSEIWMLRWSRALETWELKRPTRSAVASPVTFQLTKKEAIREAAAIAWLSSIADHPVILRICNKNGRISQERSYGVDRKDRKG